MAEMKRLVLNDLPPTEEEKAFDAALEEMNKATAHIPDAPEGEPQLCQCPCHYRAMMHIRACCERCPKCSGQYSRHFDKHVAECKGDNCTECKGTGYKFDMVKWGKEPFDPCPRCKGSKKEPKED